MNQDISMAFTEADSDHEMESLMLFENENDKNSDSDNGLLKIPKKHAKKMLSSDSEGEEGVPKSSEILQDNIDSDKNENVVASPELETQMRKKISALIDSDSESEINHSENNSNNSLSPKQRVKKLTKKAKKKSDNILAGLNLDFGSSDSSSDESIAGSAKSSNIGNESEEELSGDEFIRKSSENQGHPDSEKKQRISAKEAMKNMKTIQSESQRMAREAYVDIPYHKPKQLSLQEFLSRKGVMRKDNTKMGHAMKTTAAAIKMSQEELKAYDKLLKEREKEAAEFFKSESEPEEDAISNKSDEDKSEEPVVNEISEKTNSELLQEIDHALSNAIDHQDNIISLIENTKTVEETSETAMEVVNEDEVPSKESSEPEKLTDTIDSDSVVENDISEPQSTITAKIEAKKSRLRSLLGELPEFKPLTSDPTLVIDLETGEVVKKELSGPELLKEKYLRNAIVKTQVPHDTDLQIVSLENGLHIEHVIVKPETNTLKVKKDVKPGAAYVKLKEELEKKITENRLKSVLEREGYAKKLEEEQAQYSGEEGDSDVDEIEDETENADENETEDAPQEDDLNENEENLLNKEQNEHLSSDSSDSDSSDDSSDEDLPNPSTATKKGRIIKAFVDSDDETERPTEDTNLNASINASIQEGDVSLSDSLPLGQVIPSDKETKMMETSMTSDTSFKIPETPDEILDPSSKSMEQLWDEPNDRLNEDDLSELCSGRFGITQATVPDLIQEPTGIQVLCDKGLTQAINEEDLSDLCSGRFVTQVENIVESNEKEDLQESVVEKVPHFTKRNIILSSDEENSEKNVTESLSAKKIKKLKKKKRRQAIEISDDESSESDQEDDIEAEESSVEDPEEAEVFIDYDSEENEIEVKLTKKDRQKAATNYFENEAELSGSEYGSADEDEQNLDRLEMELGDEDKFDHDQLQSELGEIHMRRIQDQDNREVKILQEMFFQDEEKHAGRTRKFMWKNVDGVVNLMDSAGGADDDQQGHQSDEENEEEWRKMRHEREVLLAKNNEEQENALQLSMDNIQENVSGTNLVTKKRLTIIRKHNTTDTSLNNKNSDSPFLISFDKIFKESRGSFLTRDEETLNKLAGMVKNKGGDGTASALGKARNFVFSVVTPPQEKNIDNKSQKRPSNAGEEENNGQNKRQKVEKVDNKFKKRLLDNLA